jgi:hypothetical protein
MESLWTKIFDSQSALHPHDCIIELKQLHMTQPSPSTTAAKCLVESRWSLAGEDLGASCLGNTVRKREFEVLGKELLDVWSLNIIRLLKLDDFQNL